MSLFGNIVKSVAVNATIEVVDNVMKNQQAKTYIYTIEDSYYYSQKNYLDVKKELEACGFTNISLLPIRDLIKGWFVKDGSVEKVIINGKDSFKKKAKFERNVPVVIRYHTKKK